MIYQIGSDRDTRVCPPNDAHPGTVEWLPADPEDPHPACPACGRLA